MTAQLAPLITASCVTAYWVTVAIKAIRIRRVIRKYPNLTPHGRAERLLSAVWTPAVALWIIYPWLAARSVHTSSLPSSLVSAAGAVGCILALLGSFHCWREMGTSWRLGIGRNEKTALVLSGAYHRGRHPIYALSILLVLGTLAAIPTTVLLVVAAIHATLMHIEARREEQHRLRVHGDVYRDYMRSAGRFIPRF